MYAYQDTTVPALIRGCDLNLIQVLKCPAAFSGQEIELFGNFPLFFVHSFLVSLLITTNKYRMAVPVGVANKHQIH